MKKRVLCTGIASLAIATQAQALTWTDDSLAYTYGPYYREPGIVSAQQPGGANIGKNILEFTHADGFTYGTNFFNVDMLMSNAVDPANGSSSGAQEVYVVYRNDLSLSKLTGSGYFSFGPVSDIGINSGFNFDTKDTTYAPRGRELLLGPSVHLKVPGGFWQVALDGYKEWNNDGFHGPVNYHLTYTVESSWSIPLHLASLPLTLEGYLCVKGPKGYDYDVGTKTEILFHPKIMLDVGQLAGEKKHWIEAGLGWEYWYHKYGDPDSLGGAIQSTPFIEARVHF